MNFIFRFCFIIVLLGFIACDSSDPNVVSKRESKRNHIPLSYTSNEDTSFVLPFYHDTINRKDEKGFKQGFWHINNHEGVQQEGFFSDNKRQGTWTFTFTNINLSQSTFTVLYKDDQMQKLN